VHELSIAMNLVEIATAEARRRELPPVVAVHVRVGRLSSVDEESLRFCWQAATDGTPLAGSRLVVESVAVAVQCPSCGERELPSILDLRCPDCGLPTAAVVRGRELDLVGLEVTDAQPSPAAAGRPARG
jgi:hydrogenase nickel incorporation protein HypA/HybF